MYICRYIPEIWNFGDIMVLVWTPPPPQPPPPHAKACVSRNCDTNARIREEEPYRSWRKSEELKWVAILRKYYEKACALHDLIKNARINFVFDAATDLLLREIPIDSLSLSIKVAYWSEMARNAIESYFRSSKMTAGAHFVKKNLKK